MTDGTALPTADHLLRAGLRAAIQEAMVKEAAANAASARATAQQVFKPARNHGSTQVELTLADGTKVGLISIKKGGTTTDVDEDLLYLVAAANEPADLEDYVTPAALTDPRALKLLAEYAPDLVGRRIKADAAELYAREIDDNGGKVLDRSGILGPPGERVKVAGITHHDASGEFSIRPTSKGYQQIREALDAGRLSLDGSYPEPAPPEPADDEADERDPDEDQAAPAADDHVGEAIERALSHGPTAIPARNTGPEPNEEQQAVLDVVPSGDNIVIRARAGAGKSTTLTMVSRVLDGRQGLYLAFNRAVVNDAKRKFGRGVTVTTAHSLAMAAVGQPYRGRLNGPRVPANRAALILGINEPLRFDKDRAPLSPAQQARIALETVGRFCRSDDEQLDQRHIPFKDGLNTPEIMSVLRKAITPKAQRAWEDLQLTAEQVANSPGEHLRYDHDHYLKKWGLGNPRLPFDYILYDECQDADSVVLKVVLDQQDAQLIAVGDEAQNIYAWRGSVNSMDSFPAKHRMTLSQSFRFGPSIAREANKWLAVLGSAPPVVGWDRISSMLVDSLDAPNAVLCRTNAGCISEVLAAAGAGRRAAIVGGGKEIKALAEAARDLKLGKGTAHPELYGFGSWAEVQDHADNDPSGTDLRVLVKLIDDHGPEEIIRIVNGLADEADAEVVISTAHKAKGREWMSVRVGDDWRPPAENAAIWPDEARLAYVTLTRAKGFLRRGPLAYIDDFITKPKEVVA
jgi:hypothetical protein